MAKNRDKKNRDKMKHRWWLVVIIAVVVFVAALGTYKIKSKESLSGMPQ